MFSPVTPHWPDAALVVMLAGQVMFGSWLSTTVTDCEQVLLLPPTSITIQWTVVAPTGNCVGASLVTLPTAQLSPVSGEPRATPVAKHWPTSALVLTLAGQVIEGGSLSTTVTDC